MVFNSNSSILALYDQLPLSRVMILRVDTTLISWVIRAFIKQKNPNVIYGRFFACIPIKMQLRFQKTRKQLIYKVRELTMNGMHKNLSI